MNYIVWVGGVPVYEGKSYSIAESLVEEYTKDGYDDVAFEGIPTKKQGE